MNKKQIKEVLGVLIDEGSYIYTSGLTDYQKDYFENSSKEDQEFSKEADKKVKYPKGDYHAWYDKSYEILRFLYPRRLEEFERLYTGDKTIRKLEDLDVMTAGIKHYIRGYFITENNVKEYFFNVFESGFREQLNILIAIEKNIDHELFNLERDIHHDIYKSELDIAKDLNKQGYLRASGAIAGVILEVHLKNLATNRGVMPKKKDPGMSDYNDALKDSIYDIATWRQIQTCGDIRNLCVHPKEAEPTKYQINTIISTVEIIITTYN